MKPHHLSILLAILTLVFGSLSFSQVDEEVEVLAGDELRDVAMDETHVWVATAKGINRYDRSTKKWELFTTADGLVSNDINCIDVEWHEKLWGKRSGTSVWVGTDSGISVYDKVTKKWHTFTIKDGLIDNNVRDISARGDYVWIAASKGVSVYDKKKKRWLNHPRLPGIVNGEITCIYHDYRYVWVGTTAGLSRYNIKEKEWEYFTKRGSFWMSPAGGKRPADTRHGIPQNILSPFPDDRINSIDGNEQYVYIGTSNGLMRYDISRSQGVTAETNAWAKLQRPGRYMRDARAFTGGRSLAGVNRMLHKKNLRQVAWEGFGWDFFQPSSILLEERNKISDEIVDVEVFGSFVWVATRFGLFKFDPKMNSYEWHTKEQGFFENDITTVTTSGNEVWVGFPHGLSVQNLESSGWRTFKMERALPSSYVTTLDADPKWMWFGTPGAVSRFNPNSERWKTFTRDDGLGGEKISSLAVVGNYVWAGTDEGVSLLDKATSRWTTFNAQKSGLADNDVTGVLVDGKNIWVGTKLGLSLYDNVTKSWKTYSTGVKDKNGHSLSDDRITALAADPNFLWVGTRAGLNRLEKTPETWEVFTPADGLASPLVMTLAVDDQRVVVASREGLSVLDRASGEWTTLNLKEVGEIRALGLDGDVLWLGGRGFIAQYNLASGEIRRFTDKDAEGLSSLEVFGVKGSAGFIWFATDNGIYRYHKGDGSWWTYSPTKQRGTTEMLVDSNVQTIVSNEEYVYVGTPLGISRYDKRTQNWTNITGRDGLADPDVRALLSDRKDLWAATAGGVSRYDPVADVWKTYTRKDGLPSNETYALAKAGEVVWVGTANGAARFDRQTETWSAVTSAEGLQLAHVWAIAVDGEKIWFGTNSGVFIRDQKSGKWTQYTTHDGLIGSRVNSIGLTDKYVFLNSPHGTTIYDKELETFSHFSTVDGLPNNTVKTAVAWEKFVWLGTTGGAMLYDGVTDLPEEIFTYDDGLASDNVQAICIDGFDIWFGTDAGLTRYNWLKQTWTTLKSAPKVGKEAQTASLVSHNIKSLALDEDYLWVGTRAGLSRYDMISGDWEHIPVAAQPGSAGGPGDILSKVLRGLETNSGFQIEQSSAVLNREPSVRHIIPDGRFLWLGTAEGLILFDKLQEMQLAFLADFAPVLDMDKTEDAIWISTPDVIARLQRHRSVDRWTIITDDGVSEIDLSAGLPSVKEKEKEGLGVTNCTELLPVGERIWIGREQGLLILDLKKKLPVTEVDIPAPLMAAKITDMAADGDFIWVGAREGLYRFGLLSGKWQNFSTNDGLASRYVSDIMVEPEAIWVASPDGGVSRFDRATEQWETLNMQDGLSDDNVRAVAATDRYVWFGTFSGGVSRYDKLSNLWTTYKTAGNWAMR